MSLGSATLNPRYCSQVILETSIVTCASAARVASDVIRMIRVILLITAPQKIRRVGLEDAADRDAIGKHVVVVVVPFAGQARGRCALENQRLSPTPDLYVAETQRLLDGPPATDCYLGALRSGSLRSVEQFRK